MEKILTCPQCRGNDIFNHKEAKLYECECNHIWKEIKNTGHYKDFSYSKPYCMCEDGCGLWYNITEVQKELNSKLGYYICPKCGSKSTKIYKKK